MSINTAKATEIGDIHILLKINISEIKLSTTICPATMLANKRIINAIGFEKIPIISTTHIIGSIQKGTSGKKMCFQ